MISIESDEPEETYGEEDDDDETSEIFIPVPSKNASSEDISSEMDAELLTKMRQSRLIFYHTILNFNDTDEEGVLKHCGGKEKC